MKPIYGPFGAEAGAHAVVIRMTGPGDPLVPSVLGQQQKRQLLAGACEASKLPLGGHHKHVLGWLAESAAAKTPASEIAAITAQRGRPGRGRLMADRPPAAWPAPGR